MKKINKKTWITIIVIIAIIIIVYNQYKFKPTDYYSVGDLVPDGSAPDPANQQA